MKKNAFSGNVRKFAAKIKADQMKRFHHVLGTMLMATAMLSSCLSNDNSDVTLYNDAVITEFTLGTMNRYDAVKTDSVIGSYTGSSYPMVIDNLSSPCKIYNRDLLPVGTRITAVTCNISTLNNGVVAIKNTTDSLFQWYTSSQTYDFTQQPRIFRVFASDGSFYRDYQVSLTVNTTSSTVFNWDSNAVGETSLLAGFDGMRIAVLRDSVLVALGEKEGLPRLRLSTNAGKTWQIADSTRFAANAWKSMVKKDSTLYVYTKGTLLQTNDGTLWTPTTITSAPAIKQLVGAGTKELFALTTDSLIVASTDGGATWSTEQLDDKKTLLPADSIACVATPYAPSDSTDYVLMVGHSDSQTRVWRKISQYGGKHIGGKWVNIPAESINRFLLPVMKHYDLAYCGSRIVAIGTTTTVYETQDQGITWKENSDFKLPAEAIAACANNKNLWMITTTGKVWKGEVK